MFVLVLKICMWQGFWLSSIFETITGCWTWLVLRKYCNYCFSLEKYVHCTYELRRKFKTPQRKVKRVNTNTNTGPQTPRRKSRYFLEKSCQEIFCRKWNSSYTSVQCYCFRNEQEREIHTYFPLRKVRRREPQFDFKCNLRRWPKQ